MRIAMVIPSLERGGAEVQFVLLANALAARGHRVTAVVLGGEMGMTNDLRVASIRQLHKRSRWDLARTLAGLAGILRQERPDVVYGFLCTANILAALSRLFCPGPALVFGLRASDMENTGIGLAGTMLYKLERLFSNVAELVVANSQAGMRYALAKGIPPWKTAVVRNAVAPSLAPNRQGGALLRHEWGLGPDRRVVGMVARLDPVKNHLGFAEAAALAVQTRPDVSFVLVGGGPEPYAQQVRQRMEALGLSGRFIMAGERTDMAAVYAALDLLCLPSASEGVPNVLCEAMACGVPCCATDVGDCADLVAHTGEIAPSGSAPALAAALLRLLNRLDDEGDALRESCRERARAEFGLDRLVTTTETLLRKAVEARR